MAAKEETASAPASAAAGCRAPCAGGAARWLFLWCMRLHAAWFALLAAVMPRRVFGFYDFLSLVVGGMIRPLRFTAEGLDSCARPKEMLKIYERAGSAGSLVVRETLNALDLDHLVLPCPRETLAARDNECLNSRYRPELKALSGSLEIPFLVDPNRDAKVSGAAAVKEYLWQHYGAAASPTAAYTFYMRPWVQWITCSIRAYARPCPAMGYLRAPSRKPEKPLELWGYEASPFVLRVQEVLSSCETPYVYRILPWGSPKRTAFAKDHAGDLSATRKKAGMVRVPFLRDPNHGVEMFESAEINRYIQEKYQTAAVPNEKWTDIGATD